MSQVETSGHIHEMKDGILHVYVKPGVPTLEIIEESNNYMRSLDKKLLILCDPNDATALDKHQRQELKKSLEEFTIAFAMLHKTLMVPLVFSLVQKFTKPSFPMKMFKTEEEAIKWLKSFEK